MKYCTFTAITILLFFGVTRSDAQSIWIGVDAGANLSYLAGKQITYFGVFPAHNNKANIDHKYYPGFNLGFQSDFYPLKTPKRFLLISLSLGYQQSTQSISWIGTGNPTIVNYTTWGYYEYKVNRELYYELLMGIFYKGFVFKTGLFFHHNIANSGTMYYKEDSITLTKCENCKWPNDDYKVSFYEHKVFLRLAIPFHFIYYFRIGERILLGPEVNLQIEVKHSELFDYGIYGNVWGPISKLTLGATIVILQSNKKR
ncbi:MAG TPA: hypothetical protein VG603_03255 [Chitinophagales bacterium]|nr:hypothetical protein [Chitinophagales bacterium]